jgi:osmotically-inducible protein OsmY
MPGLGRLGLPVTVGVTGLVLISIGQVVPNRHSIENDLTDRSSEALQSADLTGLTVSFTGRDATVTGPADLIGQAVSVVGAVDGVRVAKSKGGVPAAPPPAPTAAPASPAPTDTPAPTDAPTATDAPAATDSPASTPGAVVPVGFTLADGTLTVTGTVSSDAARTALIHAARAAGHGWSVVDRLTVDDSLPAPVRPSTGRLPAVTRLLAAAPADGDKLVIQYSDAKVILRGTPHSAAAERALLTAAASTVSGKSAVVDGLDVAP